MPRVTWSAKSSGKRPQLTKATLKKYFNPVVIKHRDRAWSHYRTITNHWSAKNRPQYRRVTGMKNMPGVGLSIYSSVGIDDPSTPLHWLDQGTKVRYRTMSRDWKSKTYPYMGLSGQTNGRGFAAGWGYHAGIQPRLFRKAIYEIIEPKFYSDAHAAFERMCKDLWKTK